MAKKRGRPPKATRGPYKSDIVDPDQPGSGGIRLRQHRLAKGWTIEMLAERADVSKALVQGIEAAKIGFSPETLQKFAKALGTTVGALFDVDPRDGGGSEIWPILNDLTGSERQRVKDYALGIRGSRK